MTTNSPGPFSIDEPPRVTTAGRPVEKVSTGYVWMLIIAFLGVYLAFVTPLGYSMAIKISRIAPGHQEYLGYVTGVGAFASMVAGPVVGMLSDRTRSRFGRRRPFLVLGSVIGMLGLLVMAEASSALVLGIGWMVTQMGWGPVTNLLLTSQADMLPEAQRGRVSGLTGVVNQVAPIIGVLIAGGFVDNSLLLFLVPGVLGLIAMLVFVLRVDEPDSRSLPPAPKGDMLRTIAKSYVFNPRRYPDFAWNWFGKFLVFFGITLNTTFTTFFIAERTGKDVTDVAGTIAILGMSSVVSAVLGAVGGGFLSDRLQRRRILTLIGAVFFGAGAALMALAPTLALIVASAFLANLGLGLFFSVDQALTLDVLPERDTDAGRYMGVFALAITLPQGLAPFLAPLFLLAGSSDGSKNYTLLYLVAGAVSALGGLIIFFRVKSVR
ncbi:MFS transporter [Streptomyces sp. NPDC097610]|uniref:MFS transporter n=1 Tax=Streptomyces sp. NPDC097610 TaxID=3157227 RepID=UPI00331AD267